MTLPEGDHLGFLIMSALDAPPAPAVEVVVASFTHEGKVRDLNEDNLLVNFPFFLVADGMGGHDHGEVASAMVVELLPTLVAARPVTVPALRDAVLECNRRVHLESTGSRGMGTTVTGVVVVDDPQRPNLLLLNVGDSRTYRVRFGVLEQLTLDHSRVQELFQVGAITADERATHPERNVITRAVGVEALLTPDVAIVSPLVGDRFLVCSDGLSGELDDHQLAACLQPAQAEEAVQLLREAVLATPCRDNVTAIVLDVVAVHVPTFDTDADRTDPRPRPMPVAAEDETQPRQSSDPMIVDLIDDVPSATPSGGASRVEPDADAMIGAIPGMEREDEPN